MAFEKIGLGGILRFNERQAITGMRRAAAGFNRLRGGVRSLGAGFGMLSDGMRNAGLGMLPLTVGMGFGAKKAADFEKQMSAVGAITRASADDLSALTNEAKRQGVVSVFSAQQSAEAMEFMGRAGFSTTQIVKGLGGVMAAAAADGITLATSSDIIAKVVKGMGLEIDQASHVADILALTSAKTNTSITALGESFTYGAPQAKTLGVSVEETAAAFGLMADAGLRGSIGGTSFMNMLVKLSKPSSKAAGLMKNMGIQLTEVDGSLKPLPNIIGQFKKELDKVNDVTKRGAMMAELFGLRGAKAYSALSLAGREKMAQLTEDLEESSFGLGAAQEMANKRLDNFSGALTLFGSSLEAVAIEFFGPFLKSFKETTQDMTAALNGVLFAVQALKAVREQAALSAVKAAKRESASLVEQQGVLANLARREQSTARVGIAAIQTRIIGEERLTREQTRARSRSFAEFVKGNLAREKLTAKQLNRERKALEAFIEKNEEGKLSTEERIAMERQYLRTLVTLGAKGKKIGREEASNRARNLESLIKQRAEIARFEAAAEAVILREEKLAEVEKKHGTTARLIAEGVLAAIDQIKAGFDTVIATVKAFGDQLGAAVGPGRMKEFARIATIAVVVAGAIAPLFLAFAALGFLIKSVFIPQIVGAYKVLAGLKSVVLGAAGVIKGVLAAAFWPLLIVIGLATAAFFLIRKEGESVGETFGRLWTWIKQLATSMFGFRREGESVVDTLRRGFEWLRQGAELLWTAGIKPFLVDSWELVKAAVNSVVAIMRQAWDQISIAWSEFGGSKKLEARLLGIWDVVKTVADGIGGAIMTVIDVVRTAIMPFITGFVSGFISGLSPILGEWGTIWGYVVDVFDSVWGIITEIFGVFSDVWTKVVDMFVDSTDKSSSKWSGFGETVGQVVAWIVDKLSWLVKAVVWVVKTTLQIVGWLIKGLLKVFRVFVKLVLPQLLLPFKALWDGIKGIASGILDLFRGNFTQGLKKIFLAVADILWLPFRMMIKGIVSLAKVIPKSLLDKVVSSDTIDKLDKFAKFGFAGPPKKVKQTVETVTKGAAETGKVIDLAAERRKRGLADVPGKISMPAAKVTGSKDAARISEILKATGKEATAENVLAARAALGEVGKRRREEAAQREKAADKQLMANVKVEDKRTLDITNRMCVDGEAMNVASSKNKQEVWERNGATHEPYLKKLSTETGVRVAGNSRG